MPHRVFPGNGELATMGCGCGGTFVGCQVEITKKYAKAYASAPKKGKSQILDQVVAVTGWNRDHARQQLTARLQQVPGRAAATVAVIDRRKTKPRSTPTTRSPCCSFTWSAFWFQIDQDLNNPDSSVPKGISTFQPAVPTPTTPSGSTDQG